jgi:hypothetical protein
VLRSRGVAPVVEGGLRVAAAMLEPDLVVAGSAGPAQLELAARAHGELRARFGELLYARIDLVCDEHGRPLVSELELIEPNLYMATAADSAARFAAAVRRS